MTSEIRTNTLKNRVGLGTISFTNTGAIVSGIVTANSFKGDGSSLTGIDATALKDPAGNVKIQAQASGAIHSGISTFNEIKLGDNNKIKIGGGGDGYELYHDTTASYIKESGTGNLRILASNLRLADSNNNQYAFFYAGGAAELNFAGNKKFETTNAGITVTGQGVFSSAITASTYIQGTSSNGGLKFYSDSSASKGVVLNTDDHLVPSHDSNSDLGLNGTRWRNLYADTLYGDGSNLTGLSGVSVANQSDNRLITATGTTDALNGETRLTFDGNSLDISGSGSHPFSVSGGDFRNLVISGNSASSSGFIYLGNGAATNNADFDLGRIRIYNGATQVVQISGSTDTSANDDGRIVFATRNTGGSLQERARITSGGEFQIQHFSPPDGSSASRAARSALEIKRHYPQKTSGNYWIKDNNGTARQIYCEMETDGGGWMLWHDHNAPGSKVSMNIALGGSDASPSSNLSRSNYNNYAYYSVWIKASQIDATGERLHSFVTLDGDGEIKYIADYGADFLYEHVGDAYQPNLNEYFASNSTTEYVTNTQMYDPQCGATGWQSFSNGGWSEVYIREMDTRMNPGDHRGLHLVERIYGFDSAGVPRWSVAESNQPLPYWSDVTLFGGESANGAQDMLSFGNRRLKADAGNNGPSIQGRSKGILTGTFEYEFQLGYSWGWSIGALISTIQIENSLKSGNSGAVYSHYNNPYFHASLYNNSSNNLWYAPTRPAWNNSDTSTTYSGGASSGSNVLWRETDGTIKAKTKGANVSHTHTFPFKFAGPLILCSGDQSPHFTYLYDVWNNDKNDTTLNNRNRWYK